MNPKPPTPFAEEIELLEERVAIKSEVPLNQFTKESEDRYILKVREVGVVVEVDRLRRDGPELKGELCVRCTLPGARTYDGVVSRADFNLSSTRSRAEWARLCAVRSNADGLDWAGYLEEFCQRVMTAERAGQPAVDLREIERPGPDDALRVEGLSLPRRHPAILFGDGGTCKSYLGLYLAGRLAEQGLRVALWDWELCPEDHRDRLQRLFGVGMPKILYARCERPLIHEVDRLQRIARDEGLDYVLYDSVAFATDGPPESAESASRYFRAARQIGVGGLHVAHITKTDGGDQKPFGSVFFHNGARATWNIKIADESPAGDKLSLGLFARKANLGRLPRPTGFVFEFGLDRTFVTRSDPANTPDLAEHMTVKERMMYLLRQGSLTVDEVAEEIGVTPNSIYKSVQRHGRLFTLLEGGKVGLSTT
jgi:hypothetical protein